MAIDRKKLVERHNPKLMEIDYTSPLTLGNGEFAFTADVTGCQSLYQDYLIHNMPLCTMSQWGWHTRPASEQFHAYTLEDIPLTSYKAKDRSVYYAVEEKRGSEEIYQWLRKNPHRLNLGRIGLLYEHTEIVAEDITKINQELFLYEGKLESNFLLQGTPCKVTTVVDQKLDMVSFRLVSDLLVDQRLEMILEFPYGSPDISGSDWEAENQHSSKLYKTDQEQYMIHRVLDKDEYYVGISGSGIVVDKRKKHTISIRSVYRNKLEISIGFYKSSSIPKQVFSQSLQNSKKVWKEFWEKGGAVDLHQSKDSRWLELERRIVLSQYLLAIQSSGSMPPQETGLTCNSWYGKFHLEMHFWHSGWLPLFGHPELLIKSVSWYRDIFEKAKQNAKKNGYLGARWPKMVSYDGMDSPSTIATLLIWQQPHIIYMIELIYHSTQDAKFLSEHWDLIKETADFMVDFLVFDEEKGRYELLGPYIPAQERHDPRITQNATFEVEYWRFGLQLAYLIGQRLGKEIKVYKEVADLIIEPCVMEERYLAHENCPDTFTKFNEDHPSMVGAYGLLPSNHMIPKYMEKTLSKIYEAWDFESMWGWDFALLAMSEIRLGNYEKAMDLLLMDSPKNCYVTSGNNAQLLRNDLPLYLPGNGSLLLAIAMLTAGFGLNTNVASCLSETGKWSIEYENILPLPY